MAKIKFTTKYINKPTQAAIQSFNKNVYALIKSNNKKNNVGLDK